MEVYSMHVHQSQAGPSSVTGDAGEHDRHNGICYDPDPGLFSFAFLEHAP